VSPGAAQWNGMSMDQKAPWQKLASDASRQYAAKKLKMAKTKPAVAKAKPALAKAKPAVAKAKPGAAKPKTTSKSVSIKTAKTVAKSTKIHAAAGARKSPKLIRKIKVTLFLHQERSVKFRAVSESAHTV